MNTAFDLNLEHSYAEALRQQHGAVDGQRFITELEDRIGSVIHRLQQRHHVLPGVGDRLQVDADTVVTVIARSFELEGKVWFSVQRYRA